MWAEKLANFFLNFYEGLYAGRDQQFSTAMAEIRFKELGLLEDQYPNRLFQQGEEAYKNYKFDEAISYFEKSLKMCKKICSLDKKRTMKETIATVLYHLRDMHNILGQHEKALGYAKEAFAISNRTNNLSLKATCLAALGNTYSELRQYEKAIYYFRKASTVCKKMGYPEGVAGALASIGGSYTDLKEFKRAINYYKKAAKANKKNNPRAQVLSLGGLGHTYASLGEYEKAVFYLKKALKISKKLKDLKLEADILSSMGMTYLRQKKYGKAKKNFLQEEKIWRKKGYQISRGAMAEYYLTLKNYKKALSLLRQDLKQGFFVDSLFSRAPYSFEFNLHYGLALRGMGRLFEASENLCWAVEWVEKARFKIKKRVQFFTTGAYGGYIRAYRALVSVLVERILKGENQHHLFAAYGKDLTCAAFYFSEATKARILLEAMAESVKKLETVELPPELRLKEENILGQLAAVENIWEIAPARGKKTLIDIEFKKGALQKEFEDFIAQLRRDYPKYASLNYPQPLPAEQILLKDDEILLEYMLSDDTSYLFKLKKGGVEKIIKIPESKEEIEKMVGEFLVSLADRTDGAVPSESNFPLKKGRFLYDLLLSGAIKGEPRDTKIIIVPDGILGRLPFEALVIYSDKDLRETVFVADKWKITYYQSATVLTLNRLRKPPSITRDFLGIANPIFNKNDPRYTQKPASDLADSNIPKTAFRGLVSIGGDGNKILNYLPLPETEKEIQVIARFFQSPKILLGKYANERWLHRVNPRFYRFIHIATHADLAGKIQGINEPFILLGQVENGPQRNGILTLTKVLNLCFDAELVVLSACATGIGKEIEGEGLLNFARAFHYAGARSILVSLWKIGSKETVEFMELFYEYLIKEQKSKAEALSLTRQQIKQKYPHPFFWSAFVLHGEG